MNNLEKLFETIKRQSLSPHERGVSRENLKLFISEHPAEIPFAVRASTEIRETFTMFRFISTMRLHPALLSLALVLSLGVGTSYAAENTLPGDILYPVKININEQVQGALAATPQAKADWNAKRVSRRLEEVEALVADDRLTAEHSATIRTEIENSSEDFNVSIAVLTTEDFDSETVVDAQSNLEATLNAHARILVALSEVKPDDREHLRPILAVVQARAEGAKHSRAKAEATMAEKKNSGTRSAAVAKKNAAKIKIDTVRMLASEVEMTLGASTSEEASTSAFQAEQVIGAGTEHFERGDYGKAFNTFEAAIREAQETKVNVDAHVRLHNRVHLPLISTATTSSNSGKSGSDDDDDEER